MRWLIPLSMFVFCSVEAFGKEIDFELKKAELEVRARELDLSLAQVLLKKAVIISTIAQVKNDRVHELVEKKLAKEEVLVEAHRAMDLAVVNQMIAAVHVNQAQIGLEQAKLELAAIRARRKP